MELFLFLTRTHFAVVKEYASPLEFTAEAIFGSSVIMKPVRTYFYAISNGKRYTQTARVMTLHVTYAAPGCFPGEGEGVA